jgi:hypothetical protein
MSSYFVWLKIYLIVYVSFYGYFLKGKKGKTVTISDNNWLNVTARGVMYLFILFPKALFWNHYLPLKLNFQN